MAMTVGRMTPIDLVGREGPARHRSGRGAERPPGSSIGGAIGSSPMDDDVTCVATRAGVVRVAFAIDACARRIVGGRVSRGMETGRVLAALEQALHARRPCAEAGRVHHGGRGSHSLSIRDTERPAETGIEPSVGVRHCA